MREKELIAKIRELRQIKPNKDWVILTKSQILGQEPKMDLSLFFRRSVWASLTLFIILFLVFIIAQNSLPGDLLYPIKKITERSQAVFVSEDEMPKVQLELANKRLEELTKIAETNQVKKLAPAINEFQASISEAAKKIATAKKPDLKEITKETKKIEEGKQKVEALGIVIGETEELDNTLASIVEREIKELEGRSLTEAQEEILAQAKENFEAGNYSQAMEKILILSYPQL